MNQGIPLPGPCAPGVSQLILRVGWAAVNAEPLPATPRQPLADVVSGLAG